MKHVLTIAVVLWWLGMVALLVHRQARPPGRDLATLPAPADPVAGAHEEWFGIYRGDRKIGHGHRVTTRTTAGYRIEDDTRLALAMLGTPQTVHTALVADTDADFALRGFRFTLTSPAATFTASGTSDGHRLEVRYGDAAPALVPLTEPIALPATLRPRLAAGRPAPGTRFTQSVLSPLTLRTEAITITVEGYQTIAGEEVLCIAEEHQGLTARAWLAGDGSVVREEGMFGLQLRRESRAVALAGVDAAAPLDLAAAARIPFAGTIANPRALRSLALRVSGDMAARVPDDPPRQRRAGDLLRIVREAPPTADPVPDDPVLASFLAPGPFVESADPAIVARAQTVVAGAGDPAARARRLVRWVHENLAREPSLTVPSARAVLQARRGDCNEHAVLLAGLARAAGIPARLVAGAVYAGDGFSYHAWDELWLGGWVSADAVFDQLPVDATHVKLVDGGPERQLELAAVLGRLAFARVETGS